MKNLLQTSIALAVTVMLSSVAVAHPGHGEVGAAHYITSIEHVAIPLLIAIAFFILAFGGRAVRAMRRKSVA